MLNHALCKMLTIAAAAIAITTSGCLNDSPASPSPVEGKAGTASLITQESPSTPSGKTARSANTSGTTGHGRQRATTEGGSDGGETPGPVVDLTWNPPTTGGTPTSYTAVRERYDSQTIQASSCTTQAGTTECTANFDSLTLDPHYFEVRAVRNDRQGEGSTVRVTVRESQPESAPGPVTGLTATQISGTMDVVVSWTAPTGTRVDSYTVGPENNTVTMQASSCTTTPGSTTCTMTFADNAVGTHSFSVTATNGSGTSSATTTVTVSEASAPGAVQNVRGEQQGYRNVVTLSWEALTTGTASGYSITRGRTDTRRLS